MGTRRGRGGHTGWWHAGWPAPAGLRAATTLACATHQRSMPPARARLNRAALQGKIWYQAGRRRRSCPNSPGRAGSGWRMHRVRDTQGNGGGEEAGSGLHCSSGSQASVPLLPRPPVRHSWKHSTSASRWCRQRRSRGWRSAQRSITPRRLYVATEKVARVPACGGGMARRMRLRPKSLLMAHCPKDTEAKPRKAPRPAKEAGTAVGGTRVALALKAAARCRPAAFSDLHGCLGRWARRGATPGGLWQRRSVGAALGSMF